MSSESAKLSACTRCHTQKLRCPRTREGNKGCDRCLQAGVECLVRPTKRLGRPYDSSRSKGSNRIDPDSDMEMGSVTASRSDSVSTELSLGQKRVRKRRRKHTSSSRRSSTEDSTPSERGTHPPPSVPQDDWETGAASSIWQDNRITGECTRPNTQVQLDKVKEGSLQTWELGNDNVSPFTPSTTLCPISWSCVPTQVDLMANGLMNFDFDRAFTNLGVSAASTVATPFNAADNPGRTTTNATLESDLVSSTAIAHGPESSQSLFETHLFEQPKTSTSSSRHNTSEAPKKPKTTDTLEELLEQLSELHLSLYKTSKSIASTTANVVPRTSLEDRSALFGSPRPFIDIITRSPCSKALEECVGIGSALSSSLLFVEILRRLSKLTATSLSTTSSPGNLRESNTDSPELPRLEGSPPVVGQKVPHKKFRRVGLSNSVSTTLPSQQLDSTLVLLILTCYLRLLDIYEVVCRYLLVHQEAASKAKRTGSRSPFGIDNLVNLQIEDFSPPISSDLNTILLVQLISHFLKRIDISMRLNLSPYSAQIHSFNSPSSSPGSSRATSEAAETSSGSETRPEARSRNCNENCSFITTDAAIVGLESVSEEMRKRELTVKKLLRRLKELVLSSSLDELH